MLKRITSGLMGLGVACLVMVVLGDISEQFNILPAMAWARPNSPGNHLNLISALVGTAAITLALIARARK